MMSSDEEVYMSHDKLESQYPINRPTDDDEELEQEEEQHNSEASDRSPRDESQEAKTIVTANGTVYTEQMLLERLAKTGLLDDYLGGGMEMSVRSSQWVESFSRDELLQIFTTFPAIFELSKTQMSKTLGPAVKDVVLFNDTFCTLFENILKKAKDIHLIHGWGFSSGTPEFDAFEFAVSLFYTFVDEDSQTLPKTLSLNKALDAFAESNFVNLNKAGLPPLYTQLYKIIYEGQCSAGFSEQLSKTYTAIMMARAILFYGNVLQATQAKEQSTNSSLWDYGQAATFFKMKEDLKKEIDSPLYHGNIDSDKAKHLLTNPGDYLVRYSSSQKGTFLTVMLDNRKYGAVAINLAIPEEHLESWITKPLEHRAEIEGYIRGKLMEQTGKIKSFIDTFLQNEVYAQVLNPLCNEDIRNAALGPG